MGPSPRTYVLRLCLIHQLSELRPQAGLAPPGAAGAPCLWRTMFERQQSDRPRGTRGHEGWRRRRHLMASYREALWILSWASWATTTWVNIWGGCQAEAHVKSLNDSNTVVPTVDTGDTRCGRGKVSRNKVKKLIRYSRRWRRRKTEIARPALNRD